MAKKQNNDEFVDLQFPLSGIDLTTEFEEQRTGTTQEGVNVRAFEPITNRGRGGQRAGLGKYIPHTVGLIDENGDDAPPNVIQHLAIIVDPTVEGLLADDENDGPIVDPSTSNRRRRIPAGQTRRIRAGGSGKQLNLKLPRPFLVITANDQTKDLGDTFTFAGTEFSATGLDIIDTLTTATINSTGASAGAGEGDYPVKISNIQGSVAGDGSGTAGLKKKYKIKYQSGIMTVGGSPPPVPLEYLFFLSASIAGIAATVTAEFLLDGVSIMSFSPPLGTSIFDPAFWEYETLLTGGTFPASYSPTPDVIAAGGSNLGNSSVARPSVGSHSIAIKVDWTDNGVNNVVVSIDANVYKRDQLNTVAVLMASRNFILTMPLGGGTQTGGSTNFTVDQ